MIRPEKALCPRHLDTLRWHLDCMRATASLPELMRLLSAHPLGMEEVRADVRFDKTAYTRNILAESPFFRLMLLCWRPGQISPIHDHAGSTCAVRILQGTAHETRFELTPDGLARPTHTLVYGPDDVFGGQDA